MYQFEARLFDAGEGRAFAALVSMQYDFDVTWNAIEIRPCQDQAKAKPRLSQAKAKARSR